ncbi:MAG: tRNA (N6-isopentenyl adenosine(37)-C2)-methylthiotransferase MiaB [Clostridia bacterium]|nr:tRNA (N6-isopentenyl adenosine(37)-C2)-methylthiotransferase MiaB [Clostridia bacterium]
MDRQAQYMRLFRTLEKRPKTYCIVTYGCQMNAHDSEKLAGMLTEMGMTEAPREEADFVLHNTCCIRDNAERKALGNVIWLKELKKERPDMLIGVCGCMVQEQGKAESIRRQYPFIDIAFGTGTLHKLPELLYEAVERGARMIEVDEEQNTIAEGVPVRRASPWQSYVTVMYGCNNYCTYCIVPYVRGRERSRQPDDIVREVEGLVEAGVQEVMLLGQNVNSYGRVPETGLDFAGLLRRVSETGIPRIRFMTSHPKDLSDALIEEIRRNPRVMGHFHLPAQSGNDRILQAMNRHYTVAQYMERAEKLRQARPDIGLTTDLIVGFPGETEAEFRDTLALVEKMHFDSAFTFIYSPRVGTKAAELPDQVPADVSTDRITRLIAAQDRETEQVLNSMVGQTVKVLVTDTSRRDASMLTGKCERNISVNFIGKPEDMGRIVPVTITAASRTTLKGTAV